MQKSILIIEDYPHIVEVLRIRLENAGYSVLVASDGQAGLNIAREQKPDLVILDVMLPKMNGYKVCRLLKFDAKYEQIKVFMLTSRRRQSDIDTGIETGADEYLTKPYEPKELIELIKKHIGESAKD